MLCVSVHQPWATLLVSGAKRVETRGWPLHHRGLLLIHAAKKWDADLAYIAGGQPFRRCLEVAGVKFEETEAACRRGWGMPFGMVVGQVEVVGCVETGRVGRWEQTKGEADKNYLFDNFGIMGPADGKPFLFVSDAEREFGDYSSGRFAWLFTNPVRFATPFPWRGLPGIFEIPDQAVREAVEAA